MLALDATNYHSLDADREFMSVHQFNSWRKCPAAEFARQSGTWKPKKSKAFLVGSFVDVALTQPDLLVEFVAKNAKDICQKDGVTLLKDYADAERMIARLRRDRVCMKLLTGQHQVVVTGIIHGIPWKGCVDCIPEVRLGESGRVFSDLKTTADFELGWREVRYEDGTTKNVKCEWYEVFDYWFQMAVYRELLKQQHHCEWTPVLVGVTKQDPPDAGAWAMGRRDYMDWNVQLIDEDLPRILEWKSGAVVAPGCGLNSCDYCRSVKIVEIQEARVSRWSARRNNRSSPQWKAA